MKSRWVSTSQKSTRSATGSPARAVLALEEECALLGTGALRVGDGELLSRVDARRSVRAVLRHGVERQVEARMAAVIEQPALRRRHDALQRFEARLLRREAAPHPFY